MLFKRLNKNLFVIVVVLSHISITRKPHVLFTIYFLYGGAWLRFGRAQSNEKVFHCTKSNWQR